MPQVRERYPQLKLRSKNELAKRISSKKFPRDKCLKLINDVIHNFDSYWRDSKRSEPEKGKYVRSAVGTKLGHLLSLIDERVLAPHDYLVPDFIFGGVSERNHVKAAYYLLGRRKRLTKLALDISKFFEQNDYQRIVYLFYKKCGCSLEAAKLLASLTCVTEGPKGSHSESRVLARGFATSTRLALWANLDLFLKINWVARRKLGKKGTRVAIFVDDIGIFSSDVPTSLMHDLAKDIERILLEFDKNHPLPLNKKKTSVKNYLEGPLEHLGLRLGRKGLSLGNKAFNKEKDVKRKIATSTRRDKAKLVAKKKSYKRYRKYIAMINNGTRPEK